MHPNSTVPSYGAGAEVAVPESESLTHLLFERMEELEKAVSRVHKIADKLTGGVPLLLGSQKGPEAPSPGMSPLNSRLRGVNETLASSLSALHNEIERLESFV